MRGGGIRVRRQVAALVALFVPLALAPLAFAIGSAGNDRIEGTVRVWHGDTTTSMIPVGASIETPGGLVALTRPDDAVQALAGKRVRLTGDRRAGGFEPSGDVVVTGAGPVAQVTGTANVAVLLFNFSNDTSQPWTVSQVRQATFDDATSVDEYYREVSYGQFGLSGDVFGWLTIDSTNAGCDWRTWGNLARAKALAAGIPLAGFGYVVYAFPWVPACGWAGLAYLPGTESWINGYMLSLRVVAHELGHNFGVHHASSLSCSSGGVSTTFTGSCTASEYGDPFSVMGGAATRHHVNWHRTQLGWAPDVQTATTSGSYTLAAAASTGTPRLLRVSRGDGTFLNLEYRRPKTPFEDFLADEPAVNGVSIRIARDTSWLEQSKLVDTTPATATFNDAALAPGQSVTDPLTGVSITTVSVASTEATVSIGGLGTDTTPPTGPASLTAAAVSSTSVQLSWSAATDDGGVQGYRVYRDGTQIATTSSLGHLDATAQADRTYTYDVRAFDAAGNVGAPASASATTPTFADVPPTNPFYALIEQLYDLGITTGCGVNGAGQLLYCPTDPVPRQQMAAFLMRARGQTQLLSATPTFVDVPRTNPFYGWVERLYEQGVTTGCARNQSNQLLYCPTAIVPREQMAAFVVRAKGLTPLLPATPTFADVPASHPLFGFIERLYEQQITTGCGVNGSGQLLFCPTDPVPRQQMAAFLVRAFAP